MRADGRVADLRPLREAHVEFGLLGPLEIRENGVSLPLGGAKQRALLALLLLSANRVIARDRLVDGLWDDPPESAATTVQVYVSRLRKLLPAGTLVTQAPGYVLHVEPLALDLDRFEHLVEEARRSDPLRASTLLREALALWRGPSLAEFETEPFARAEAGRLAELRLVALEEAFEAELALGRHAEVAPKLETLIAEEPLRERFRTQLMLALYRSGRQADALTVFRDARAALDEIGIEPSSSMRQLERRILAQDAALDLEVVHPLLPPGTQASRLVPSQLVPEPQAPFVGRASELELMRGLIGRAEGGSGGVVLLGAEAGGGKTRLVRELVVEAAERGTLALYGSSDPVVRTPYQPLREWLELVVRVCGPDGLRSLLGSGGNALARLVPALARLTEAPPVSREPAEERYLLHTAAAELLTGIAEQVPLILIADDIHWADVETLHLLRRLARIASGTRVLLVVGFRDRGEGRSPQLDDTLAELARLDWTQRVALGQLSSDDVRAFIRRSADAEPTDELMTAVTGLTDGTPLLVCELWRDLVESHAVAIAGAVADLTLPVAEIRGPELVRDIIRQRINRLRPPTVALLELASVAGSHVALRVVAETGELEQHALVDAVEEAAGSGIVEELSAPSGELRFAHELVRRAVYDRLSSVRRADLHGRVGTALEAVNAPDVTPVIADLAHHFTQAVPVLGASRAVEYNLRAAEAAMGSVALDEAVARLETALDLGIPDAQERKLAQIELASLLHEIHRTPEAEAILAGSVESAAEPEQRSEAARMSLFTTKSRIGDPDVDPAEMQAAAEEAIAVFAAQRDSHGLSTANRVLGIWFRRQGRLAETCKAAERSLTYADASGDPAHRRRTLGTLCYALCDGPAPVPDALDRCDDIRASTRGDRLAEALVTLARSTLLAMDGRFDEAREELDRSVAVLDSTNQMMGDVRIYRTLVAETLVLLGDRDGAAEELKAQWQWFRDPERWEVDLRAVYASCRLASLSCDQGRWDEARSWLEFGRELRIPSSFRLDSVLRLGVSARVAVHEGRVSEALELARRAVAIADLSDFVNLRARTWLVLAEADRHAGREPQAAAARAAAAALFESKGNRAEVTMLEAQERLTA